MPALINRHRRLRLVAADAVITAATAATTTDRTLRGLVLPYSADGRTSKGLVRASAGRISWAADLRRIKVFSGHNRERPVGYVTALTETPDGLRCEIHLAATPDGDRALLEAREGTRDALSVELEDAEVGDDGELIAAELVAVALVPLPAFSDARLAAERGDPAAAADAAARAAEAAERGTDDTDDDDDDDDDDTDTTESGDPTVTRTITTTEPPAPGTQAARAPAALAAARSRRRALTLEAASALLAQRYVDGGRSAAALNAALADITPVTTGSDAIAPPQWIGEIWTPEFDQLDWSNAVTKATLTSMRLTGWKRLTGPVISPYAGNKAPIPSDGTLSFGPVDVTANRHAVGADFDRVWLDFGEESVIRTWLQLVTQDYAKKLDEAVATVVLAEATDGGYAPDIITAVSVAAQTLKYNGARTSWIAISSDLYAAYLSITSADAPWWLAQSSAVNLGGNEASVNNLRIFESPGLPAATVTAGDRRAVTQYTPRGNPFTVRAVDLAKGGIDAAVFGYSAELVNDPLGIVTVTVGDDPTP